MPQTERTAVDEEYVPIWLTRQHAHQLFLIACGDAEELGRLCKPPFSQPNKYCLRYNMWCDISKQLRAHMEGSGE